MGQTTREEERNKEQNIEKEGGVGGGIKSSSWVRIYTRSAKIKDAMHSSW
jgi:hypothetical protein